MDIQWYFMSIDRDILWNKNNEAISNWENISFIWNSIYDGIPRYLVMWKFPDFLKKVIHNIIYNDPTQNGIFKGKESDYDWLPKTKSLFYTSKNCGLPIWNLTSQLFSNIYLNDFDHYMKDELKIKYYWRYVDDFVVVHRDKEYIKSIIPLIKDFLKVHLKLTLHPKKIYLQPINHGVQFLWALIKPYRLYRSKRTVSNFYRSMKECNYTPSEESLNSYLWLFMHYKQYKLVQRIMRDVKFDNMKRISDLAKYYHNNGF